MSLEPHLEDLVLGASKGPIRLDRIQPIQEASALMARQARRELLIFGRTLDPELYDQSDFLEGVKRLALNRSVMCIKVLLFDAKEATRTGHRLIEMSRRLTSRMAIQCISEDDQDRLDAFLVVDERGYVRRRLADTMEATADFDNPHESRLLRTDFEQMWERSIPDPEIRRLHI